MRAIFSEANILDFLISYIQFFCQIYSNLYTLKEPRLFVIPAEGTDGVNDLIDVFQRLAIHKPVEFFEVGFDGCVIEAAGFVIGIEQHLQDTLGIIGIVWLLSGQLGLKGSHKLIHLHRQSPPGRIQAQRTGLLRGVAAARFGPQTGPEPPSLRQSFRTGHRAIP